MLRNFQQKILLFYMLFVFLNHTLKHRVIAYGRIEVQPCVESCVENGIYNYVVQYYNMNLDKLNIKRQTLFLQICLLVKL